MVLFSIVFLIFIITITFIFNNLRNKIIKKDVLGISNFTSKLTIPIFFISFIVGYIINFNNLQDLSFYESFRLCVGWGIAIFFSFLALKTIKKQILRTWENIKTIFSKK